MKLYVISTKYQPLVTVNMQPSWGRKPVSKKSISTHDLQATFNASKTDSLIACESKEAALTITACLFKGHNTTPDFIEKGVQLFAVPVVYSIECDESVLPPQTALTADDLVNYADTTTIPLYMTYGGSFNEVEIDRLNGILKKLPETINIRKLDGLQLASVLDATYLKSDASDVVNVNLKAPAASIGLFASMGSMLSSVSTTVSEYLSTGPK